MGRQFDHSGEICGDYVVNKIDHKTKTRVYWEAQCVYCGRKRICRSDVFGNEERMKCPCQRTGNQNYQEEKLIGNVYGQLTVIEMDEESKNHVFYPNSKNHKSKWICKCSCGKITTVSQTHLITGHTKTCGSAKNHLYGKYVNDLTGNKYGLLQVIQRAENLIYNNESYVAWKCRCECGNVVTVAGTNLKNGTTKSCGCTNSIGEALILRYCLQNSLLYKRSARFEGCRDKYPLPFDFVFYNHENDPVLALEFDGIQHYIPQRWSKEISDSIMMNDFYQLQRRDKIKTDFCKNNHIPLIRIPYTQIKNISSLMDFLVSLYNLKG